MSIVIPVWVLWTLGIAGGVLAVGALGALCMFAYIGWAFSAGIGRGLNW
jgi:hypothetical protein